MTPVEQIADAVLYEGYLLYPYRASAVKNQQRFNFGVLYPREYCALQSGAEAWEMKSECLVFGSRSTAFQVRVRFLQLADRIGYQEGREREVLAFCDLAALTESPLLQAFTFEGTEQLEGEIELRAIEMEPQLFKLTLIIRNCASLPDVREMSRDEVLYRSFISVHSILHADGGDFISLLDPPERFQTAVESCHNVGAWPVLAGDSEKRDTVLCSPIILYDFPQIAAESPGDLFDGTEIDEILALRILTMTDAEKAEVRSGDDRARRILERTELLPAEHFQKLHGALRGLRAESEERHPHE
jgi:hypothetical protein